jgi:hypothetical protein
VLSSNLFGLTTTLSYFSTSQLPFCNIHMLLMLLVPLENGFCTKLIHPYQTWRWKSPPIQRVCTVSEVIILRPAMEIQRAVFCWSSHSCKNRARCWNDEEREASTQLEDAMLADLCWFSSGYIWATSWCWNLYRKMVLRILRHVYLQNPSFSFIIIFRQKKYKLK